MQQTDQFQLQTSKDHEALKARLFAAGVASGTLDVLIHSAEPQSTRTESFSTESLPQKPSEWSAAPVFVPKSTLEQNALEATTNGRDLHGNWRNERRIFPQPSLRQEEELTGENDLAVYEDGCSVEKEEDGQYDAVNREDRSLTLRGLPPQATLSDVAKIVRGGLVLNMFIRRRERTAHVTFVEPLAALKFLMHSRRNDLYIRSKRVCLPLLTQSKANVD